MRKHRKIEVRKLADKDKNTEDYLDSLLNAALKSGNTDDNDNSESMK